MRYTDFQGTKVSKLCLGNMRFPLDEKGDPVFETACALVDESLRQGISYFDTAYTYLNGKGEEIFRRSLVERHPRDSFQLTSKLPTWLIEKEADVIPKFEEQLGRCGVDYFDFYLVHDIERDWFDSLEKANIFPTLAKEKEAGRIRHLGASFHCSPVLLRECLEKWGKYIEFVQLQLNYLDWDYINAKALYKVADDFGKTVVIMEPLRGGTLSRMPSAEGRRILDEAGREHGLSYTDFAFGWLESLPRVGWILSGMAETEQVVQNAAFFSRPEGLSKAEVDAAFAAGKAMAQEVFIPCTRCNYCAGCPQGIKIPKIFSAYNEACAKDFVYLWGDLKQIYAELGPNANDCIECGACEKKCPQHIAIPEMLKKIDQKYSEL